jgi:hypothetical protein
LGALSSRSESRPAFGFSHTGFDADCGVKATGFLPKLSGLFVAACVSLEERIASGGVGEV